MNVYKNHKIYLHASPYILIELFKCFCTNWLEALSNYFLLSMNLNNSHYYNNDKDYKNIQFQQTV